jgi:hypothetical protein
MKAAHLVLGIALAAGGVAAMSTGSAAAAARGKHKPH